MDSSRTHRGRCLIDMTTRSPIDMIRFLSDWYDEMHPHFDMIDDLSY